MLSQHHKSLILLTTGLLALGGSLSCATFNTVRLMTATEPNFHTVPTLTDQVATLAHPTSGTSAGALPTQGTLLWGKRQTYLLTTGGTELLEIARFLNGKPLRALANASCGIQQSHFYLDGQQLTGQVEVIYHPRDAAEILKLGALGFVKDKSGGYYKDIKITGQLYPATQWRNLQVETFPMALDLELFNPPYVPAPADYGQRATGIALLPIAVAVDAATFPIQIAIAMVIGSTMYGQHH